MCTIVVFYAYQPHLLHYNIKFEKRKVFLKTFNKISRGDNVNGKEQNTSCEGWKRRKNELFQTKRSTGNAKPH